MRILPILLLGLSLLGCADTDELVYSETQLARIPVETRLVRVKPGEPAGDVSFGGTEAVLFWINDAPSGQLGIVVKGRPDTHHCPRTVGFVSDEEKALTVSENTVPPGGMATVCFHKAGSYEYELFVGGKPAGKGTITVAEEKGGTQ